MRELQLWLVERVAAHGSVPPHQVDLDRPLQEYGFSSRDAVVLSGELEEFLDRGLPPTVLWQHPTIRGLVAHLTGESPAEDRSGAAQHRFDGEVAVTGIGCRLPGGIDSPEDLWSFLSSGGEAISRVPEDRWAAYRAVSPEYDRTVDGATAFGGFLDDIAGFDAAFFGIAPVEAVGMDPQQRILLEVVWEALEHAGIPAAGLAGSRTGVFVGACGDDFGRRRLEDLPAITGRSGTGAALSVLANRVSYLLDLRGPSLTVDTACSSSLVALHLARQSLVSGECDTAIVAGVNLLVSPAVTLNFDRAGALSADGRCRPFDAGADGYVRSEGCLAVVLRRLPDALGAHDRVLATVRATGVNQDGRSGGLMAPNPAAQEALLTGVYAEAGVDPTDVAYVEAHGTGTPLGDPIEAGALGAALGTAHSAGAPLLIGSVKSNLGHLEGAAGLAGVVKTVLALQHAKLPPTLHYSRANPAVSMDELGLRVVDRLQDWPSGPGDRLAGVSSFGFGGTNAHAVLASAAVTSEVTS